MSDTVIVDGDQPATRRSSVDNFEPPATIETIDDDGTPAPAPQQRADGRRQRSGPSAAVQAAMDRATESDRIAQAERERASRATTERNQALGAVADRNAQLVAEREQSVLNQIAAAETVKRSALSAKKAAREAGDLDAEAKADDDIAGANYQLNKLGDAKAEVEQAKTRLAAAPKASDLPADNSQSDAWLDKHPMFYTDQLYKDACLAAHDRALRQGNAVNTPGYFTSIDSHLNRIYGEGHGDPTTHQKGAAQRRTTIGDHREPSSSTAAPRRDTSGGGDDHMSGNDQFSTPWGNVQVRPGRDGKPVFAMNGAVREAFEEGAKAMGNRPIRVRDAGGQETTQWRPWSLADYALEQYNIAKEVAAGGNAGLVVDGSTRTYR